jgi:hypothetical protein
MSVLSKNMEMRGTGDHRPLPVPMLSVTLQSNFDPIKLMNQYSISATFREKVWALEEDKSFIYKRVIMDINRAVYGDVENCLYRIEKALYEYDILAAREALKEALEAVKA